MRKKGIVASVLAVLVALLFAMAVYAADEQEVRVGVYTLVEEYWKGDGYVLTLRGMPDVPMIIARDGTDVDTLHVTRHQHDTGGFVGLYLFYYESAIFTPTAQGSYSLRIEIPDGYTFDRIDVLSPRFDPVWGEVSVVVATFSEPQLLLDDIADLDFTQIKWLLTPTGVTTRVLRFPIGSTTFTDNGVSHTLEAAPFISNGRTMVPLRVIGEALGATDLDLTRGVVSLVLDGRTITMTVGQPLPNNMGTPVIIAGRTFVPLAYIIEEMGAIARWDSTNRVAYIYID